MVLMAWLAGTFAHAGQPQYKLNVYLLDKANDGYLNYTLAETLASRMFAVIGISLEWTKGKPAAESPQRPIIIEVYGGVVQDVLNVPPGYSYKVRDYDNEDDGRPI